MGAAWIATTAEIEFVRRGRTWIDATAEVTAWRSRCGTYRVCRRRSLYERNQRGRRRVRFCAQVRVGPTAWLHVDDRRREYRSREAAEKACRQHATTGQAVY